MGSKDSRLHISRSGPYQKIIKHASNNPVVLFDPGKNDRRGWLVPESSLISHLAQTRHSRSNFTVDDAVIDIQPTNIDMSVSDSAEKMLLDNATTVLMRDPWGHSIYSFKDLVLAIWSLLEILMDQNCKQEATTEPGINAATRRKIRGWEFMDLATERNPIRMKEAILKNSAGNWAELVHGINAIVLFASGLDDLVIPQQPMGQGLFHIWTRVPRKKAYLAAGISILETLFEQAGSRKYLTSTHLQWHRGPILFENCADMGQDSRVSCKCDRVQQILPDSKMTLGKINPPETLPPQGAVIFGQSSHAFRSVYKQLLLPLRPALTSQRKSNFLLNLALLRQRVLDAPVGSETVDSGSVSLGQSLTDKDVQQSTTATASAEPEVAKSRPGLQNWLYTYFHIINLYLLPVLLGEY